MNHKGFMAQMLGWTRVAAKLPFAVTTLSSCRSLSDYGSGRKFFMTQSSEPPRRTVKRDALPVRMNGDASQSFDHSTNSSFLTGLHVDAPQLVFSLAEEKVISVRRPSHERRMLLVPVQLNNDPRFAPRRWQHDKGLQVPPEREPLAVG